MTTSTAHTRLACADRLYVAAMVLFTAAPSFTAVHGHLTVVQDLLWTSSCHSDDYAKNFSDERRMQFFALEHR